MTRTSRGPQGLAGALSFSPFLPSSSPPFRDEDCPPGCEEFVLLEELDLLEVQGAAGITRHSGCINSNGDTQTCTLVSVLVLSASSRD